MRAINLIDICGTLLNIVQKKHTTIDKITEQFFLQKRKLLGSKERKFASQAVYSTLRNINLIEKIAKTYGLNERLKHPKIFINSPEHSIYILIQIILAEKFPADFAYFDTSFLHYSVNSSTVDSINSLNIDLATIENTSDFSDFLNNYAIDFICKSFLLLNDKLSVINLRANNSTNSKETDSNSKDFTKIDNDFLEIIAEKYSFPIDFLNLFLKNQKTKFSNENILKFAEEFNKPAPICIRINTQNFTVQEVMNNLQANGIQCEKGKISNVCAVINQRHQLTNLQIYKNGGFEIQDEASQLVGFCANPKQNDSILDACAGAGGKSLHLADLQWNKGKIIASDVEFMRLKEIPKRAKRCGFHSIETAICEKIKNNNLNSSYSNEISNNSEQKDEKNGKISLLQSKKIVNSQFDIVLVDAPCSGSGTIRRDPTKKYTVTEKVINKIVEKQFQILSFYSKFVKNGGFLVYSTCSIFPQENELILERFLSENPDFAPESINEHFLNHGIFIPNLAPTSYSVTLYPFSHQTDGFFIAKMKKQL